jgi:type I restriction-modification system DNA methylase subunit
MQKNMYIDVFKTREYFEKGKRQNNLLTEHIEKIVETYKYRKMKSDILVKFMRN